MTDNKLRAALVALAVAIIAAFSALVVAINDSNPPPVTTPPVTAPTGPTNVPVPGPSGPTTTPTAPTGPTSPTTDPTKPVGNVFSGTLKFEDNFAGTAIDSTKWAVTRGPYLPGYGNPYNPDAEDAFYSGNNVAVGGGRLALNLKKGTASGYPYSSGMVQSGRSYSYRYGYVEARIKVPNCAGCWPAFWTLDAPVDNHWPPEIDIFEFFNTQGDQHPYVNYHPAAGGQTGPTRYGASGTDFTADYHVYGLLWQPGKLQVFIDGQSAWTYNNSNVTSAAQYVILNLALGKGSTPPDGQQMLVDYVRVWQ